ncbi:MAG: cyclic pyranopterin monophosphate synthase MoaC [Myxococcota bacterium]
MAGTERGDGGLTHLDSEGRARMVDIGAKAITHRVCVARGLVRMQRDTLARLTDGTLPKGDVLAAARLAGIQGAKRTPEWIPLAHPLPIDAVSVVLTPDPEDHGGPCLRIEARVEAHWRTGVEMEAMVAVSAAGLTVYDMCKAVDRGMQLEGVKLVSKSGGKSGAWTRSGEAPGGGGEGGSP